MYDDILVPTDGSEGVQRAVDHGIELAAETGGTVHGLFVVDLAEVQPLPEPKRLAVAEALEETGTRAVDDIAQRARQRGVDVTTAVERGTPHERILDYADTHDVDLVVMGTHGRTGIERVLLGSVTDKVVREADVPVLVQRVEKPRR